MLSFAKFEYSVGSYGWASISADLIENTISGILQYVNNEQEKMKSTLTTVNYEKQLINVIKQNSLHVNVVIYTLYKLR